MENKNNHFKRTILVLISVLLVFSSLFSGCVSNSNITSNNNTYNPKIYENVDDEIQSVLNDNSYDKLTLDEKISILNDKLRKLEENGSIKKGSVSYDDTNKLFSFIYPNGAGGGISLKEFDDEFDGVAPYVNKACVKKANTVTPTEYPNSSLEITDILILNGFENTEFRRMFYENLENDWDSKGVNAVLDSDVTVSDLKNLPNYDAIIFAMHGAEKDGRIAMSLNETVTRDTDKQYDNELNNNYIERVFCTDKKEHYWVYQDLFSHSYNVSSIDCKMIYVQCCMFFGCDCTSTDVNYDYANALLNISKASTVAGYHNSVESNYGRNVMKMTIDNMLAGDTVNDALKKSKKQFGNDDNYEDINNHKYIAYPVICGDDDATLLYLSVKDFSVPADMTLTLGEIDVIEAEIEPKGASDYSIKWTSSDESVATVTPTGEECIVTSKGKGTATITGELVSNGKTITKSTNVRVASKGRDTVLVLDVSGSMFGTPIDEMKKSAINFCKELLEDEYNNRVGLVLYDNYIDSVDLTNDLDLLINYIESISSGGTTNMQGALRKAEDILDSQGKDGSIKNVVVMADGLPNEGETSDTGKMSQLSKYSSYPNDVAYANAVISTAENIMSKYNMYSLGFFHDLSGIGKDFAADLMKMLTNMSDGYHQVDTAENLQFAFGDIQETISDGSKVVINIACPVDVNVTYNGETLSSAQSSYSDTASFGTLQLLGKNKDIKVLSLDPNAVYDIVLNGTGKGTMNYSVNYLDENDAIIDYRTFESIPITPNTKIDSNTNNSAGDIKLNLDEDGDGTVDKVYSASVNSVAELTYGDEPKETEVTEENEPVKSDNTWVTVMIAVVVVIILLGIILIIALVTSSNKKRNKSYNIPVIEPQNKRKENFGKISVVSGSMTGREFVIDAGKGYIIGKDSSKAQIVLAYDYGKVSREHCVISYDEKTQLYSVIDLSSNGTYYIDNKTAPLNSSVSKHKLNKNAYTELQGGCVLLLGDEDCKIALN